MAQKRALCIGINDYPGTHSDLFGCVNDANDWAHVLRDRGFTCRRLINSEATGERIREEMLALANKAEDGDIVVIFFAGHGSAVPDTDGDEADNLDECWCPHDVRTNGVITDDELNQIYEKRRKGVRWVVISDSCNSGTVSRKSRLDDDFLDEMQSAPRSRFLAPNLFVKQPQASYQAVRSVTRVSASTPGRMGPLLLASCQEDQESIDAYINGRPNGAFSYVALRALETLPNDADYAMWLDRIREYLPSVKYPQEPNLYDIGDKRKHWKVLAAEGETPRTPRPASARTPNFGTNDTRALMNGRALAAKPLSRALRSRTRTRSLRKFLIAEGDSWFKIPIWDDLVDELEKLNFDITNVATHGHMLENMAFNSKQKTGFARAFLKMVDRNEPPAAVLLSGGGNDIVGEQFRFMINPKEGSQPGLNATIVDEMINVRLREAYLTLIGAVNAISIELLGEQIPIVLHGYCAGVPDGRYYGSIFRLAGPWLKPYFDNLGYHDLDETTEIAEELLCKFNEMLQSMIQSPGLEHVHYINLLDVLPNDANYEKYWNDELHPTDRGFKRLATKMANELSKLI